MQREDARISDESSTAREETRRGPANEGKPYGFMSSGPMSKPPLLERVMGPSWDRRLLFTLALGFSSGLPLALSGSTLTFWLARVGVSNTQVGVFAFVALPYTLKFLWAPFFDRFPAPPPFSRLGRRRGWLLVTQLGVAITTFLTGITDPAISAWSTAVLAVAIAFFSASQDVVIDAYRIEILDDVQQGYGAAATQWGYRIGMIVSGAGALYMCEHLSWLVVYATMAFMMLIGMITAWHMPEPPEPIALDRTKNLLATLRETVLSPLVDFMRGRPFALLFVFLVVFRLGDALSGHMLNPFLVHTGFLPREVANVTKLVGIPATMVGVGFGGVVAARYGVPRALPFAAVIMLVSNLGFSFVAHVGHSVSALLVATVIENVTSGVGSAITVVYLSSLCSREHTAAQYALLTALISTSRTALASPSGWIVDHMDAVNRAIAMLTSQAVVVENPWVTYFAVTALAGLPGLAMATWIARHPTSIKESATREAA